MYKGTKTGETDNEIWNSASMRKSYIHSCINYDSFMHFGYL